MQGSHAVRTAVCLVHGAAGAAMHSMIGGGCELRLSPTPQYQLVHTDLAKAMLLYAPREGPHLTWMDTAMHDMGSLGHTPQREKKRINPKPFFFKHETGQT